MKKIIKKRKKILNSNNSNRFQLKNSVEMMMMKRHMKTKSKVKWLWKIEKFSLFINKLKQNYWANSKYQNVLDFSHVWIKQFKVFSNQLQNSWIKLKNIKKMKYYKINWRFFTKMFINKLFSCIMFFFFYIFAFSYRREAYFVSD